MSSAGSFVPLPIGSSAAGGAPPVFRAHVVKNADDAPFQPVTSLLPAPCPAAGAAPKLELEREGRVIKRIRITCACGQVMELECRYDTPA